MFGLLGIWVIPLSTDKDKRRGKINQQKKCGLFNLQHMRCLLCVSAMREIFTNHFDALFLYVMHHLKLQTLCD